MRKLQVCFLTAFLSSLTGCVGVVSLHPLALPTDQDAIFDPALVGTWEDVDPHFRSVYTVSRAESGNNLTLQPLPYVADDRSFEHEDEIRRIK